VKLWCEFREGEGRLRNGVSQEFKVVERSLSNVCGLVEILV
jgi:hypothetical protein